MTATNTSAMSDNCRPALWAWPLNLTHYDRRALLTGTEAQALKALEIEQVRHLGLTSQAAPARLVEPLAHARDCLHWTPGTGHQRRFARDAASLVLVRCGDLGRSYWGWSDEDWADLINRSGAEFRRHWGGQIGPNSRPFLIAYAYLLGGFTAFEQVGRFQRPTLAHRVFGDAAVEDAVGKVLTVLGDWGYQPRPDRLTSVICQILLLNRSPRLEDLSSPVLAAIRETPAMQESQWTSDLHGIHRALAALGHAEPPPCPRHGPGPTTIEGAPDSGARAAAAAGGAGGSGWPGNGRSAGTRP